MKKLALLLIPLLALTIPTKALPKTPQRIPVTGRVVDTRRQAIPYATAVLLDSVRQAAGTTTDADGRFTLRAAPGTYTLRVLYLGYETFEREIRLDRPADAGDIHLSDAPTQIDEVVVSARLLRREADRFVMDVANSPQAIGKDGAELLEHAPGVRLDERTISINGKEGTKVYVDDRPLRLDGEQLNAYLRSLRAEDIQSVEIVPVAGADYDASSSGGIIRIALKRRREQGTQGTASLTGHLGGLERTLVPRMRLNRHTGRLDIYGEASVSLSREDRTSDERTEYASSEALLTARSDNRRHAWSLKSQLGVIFQIAPQHSIGLEGEYLHEKERGRTGSRTDLAAAQQATRTESRYRTLDRDGRLSLAFNYIWKIDSRGSTLKLLVDRNRRSARGGNDNRSGIASAAGVRDSLYRDRSQARYDVATATLAWEGYLDERLTLRAGAKYARNDMRNDDRYEYLVGETWRPNLRESTATDYVEHIAAAYGILALKAGRWSAVAGLRAEHTATRSRGGSPDKHYLSLFPNANLSCTLSDKGDYSLVLQYGRTIDRPGFHTLNPRREQLSDYSFQRGNPALAPSFKHDISFTCILAGKYSFTCGTMILTDEIQSIARSDEENPDLLNITWMNFDTSHNYYAAVNAPLQAARCLQLDADLVWFRSEQHIPQMGLDVSHDSLFAGLSATVTLPAKFYVDLSYRYQSRMVMGNCWVEPMHLLNAGIKKRIGERLTLSLSARNLLDRPQRIGARGEGFVRRVEMGQRWHRLHGRLSIGYSFQSGKTFRQRTVETGSKEEKQRM